MTVTNLKKFLKENPDFTQTRVAGSIGVSVSALNAWMKGSYAGDNNKIERAVSRFLSAKKEAGEETGRFKKDFDFVETAIYKDVLRSVNLSEYRGEIRVVVGVSGVGKTRCLEKIKSDRENSMILVQCYPGMRKTRFMKKLCQAAGFDGSGTYDDMFEEIITRLKGSDRIIAIDEVEHLTIESIDAARRINDFTGCGIVLVGLPKFYNELSRRQRDYAYVYNRTAMPMKLKKNKAADLAAMAATMVKAELPEGVYKTACNGIARDLRIILLESLRVSEDNGISFTDTKAFSAVIGKVAKELGRKVA